MDKVASKIFNQCSTVYVICIWVILFGTYVYEWMILCKGKQNYIQYNYTQRYASYKAPSSVLCVWGGGWVSEWPLCVCIYICVGVGAWVSISILMW